MASEFETGCSTHAANDVALTVANSGGTYQRFKEASSPYYARVILINDCRIFGRAEYGRSFSEAELSEAVAYVLRAWSEG
jgi:hypothetical protein